MPVEIIVPPLSQTSDSLLLLEWLKKPGENVKKGESLFTVETDKASLEVESPASGILFEVFAEPQSNITVRSIIGKILTEGEDLPVKENAGGQKMPERTESIAPTTTKPEPKKENIKSEVTSKSLSSPRARKLAAENNLDLNQAIPTGVRGMVVERDVRILLEKTRLPYKTDQMSLNRTRQVIASRMLESHLGTAPVSYLREVDVTDLAAIRNQILAELPAGEVRPTYTDFLINFLCRALKQHQLLNSTFENEVLNSFLEIHIALAVDTDRGLIVPVIKNADQLTMPQLSAKRKMMVENAVDGRIRPDELSGGTFTLTNLGSLGIDFFTPIINPPQVAILGIGRIREIPAVKNGGIFIRNILGLALTCDHRVVDGAPAARFMETLSQLIENPEKAWFK